MREQLRDPLGLLATYVFEINHSTEDANDRRREVQRSANTAGTGFVRQQGATSPDVKKWSGTILTQAQLDAMNAYFAACSTRTVFFRDYTGVEWEIVITGFSTTRVPTLRNPRDPTLLHYWHYTIEFEVIA